MMSSTPQRKKRITYTFIYISLLCVTNEGVFMLFYPVIIQLGLKEKKYIKYKM